MTRPLLESRTVAALFFCAALAGAQPVNSAAAATPGDCGFTFGFQALHDQIPGIVGECRNDEYHGDNGDGLQLTQGGLLVWRKADNWTAFTNGSTTWLLGPSGVQSRPNAGPFFSWEATPPLPGLAASAPSPLPASAPAAAPSVVDALLPAWNALRQVPELGPLITDMAIKANVQTTTATLPSGNSGVFYPSRNIVAINSEILGEDARAIAPVLAHELHHAIQYAADPRQDCIAAEVKAYTIQVLVWSGIWPGNPPNRTQLESSHNYLLSYYLANGDPGMYSLIAGDKAYQAECDLWVPPGTQQPQVQPVSRPSPAPSPKVTPTPELPPDQVYSFSGTGDSRTKTFSVRGGDYTVKYSAEKRSSQEAVCYITVYLQGPSQPYGYVGDIWLYDQTADSRRSHEHLDAGSYSFNMRGDCKWAVSIDPD
jgi:hypothetical protein